MLNNLTVFFLLLLFIVIGCKPQQNNANTKKNLDSLLISKILSSKEDWQTKINKKHSSDGMQLQALLNEALQIANTHKANTFFTTRIGDTATGYNATYSTLKLGNIFSKNYKHLLVKTFVSNDSYETSLYSNIYLVTSRNFKLVVTDTANIGYSGDTLTDINEDNLLDYIVSSYSGAGCCPRDARVGYLYNNQTGGFESLSFFNPQFDHKNHFFYETDYGYPGEISIDKYRWQGKQKVMSESILSYLLPHPRFYCKAIHFYQVILSRQEEND